MSTPPVRSAPRSVVRSRTCRFSQTRHYASRQSQQLVAELSLSATGATRKSALEKWELAAANGRHSRERIQEREERA